MDLGTELLAGSVAKQEESVETGGEWASVKVELLKDRETRESKSSATQNLVTIVDVEEEEEEQSQRQRSTRQETSPRYVFDKLSDVPAVRDPSEVEAADRALERLAGKQHHQLSPSDRIWDLAARGGSTQASDDISLDSESKEKIKERLRTKKLTDKTTLKF